MIQKIGTIKEIFQQHASRSKGCAIRTRMLQDCTKAKMVLGLTFANSLQELSTCWIFYCTSFVKALTSLAKAPRAFSRFAHNQI